MFPDLLTDDAFRLETRRLWLRWPRVADAVVIAKLAGEKAVSHFTARLPYPYPVAEAEPFIMGSRKANADGKQLTLAITRKGKPDPAGMISVHPNASGQAVIGFWLGEPYWGKGLMGEALDEVLALMFTATAVRSIVVPVRDGDERTSKLLAARNFEQVESLRINMPLRGGIFPCSKFRLERADWQMHETDRFRRYSHASGPGKKVTETLLPAERGRSATQVSGGI